MKVICPKCQFENQADATRIVCARCATIIEVRADQGAGSDPNKRQTARLPFTGNTNPPLTNQPLNQRGDVYATHVGDDFEDVLDLPRQTSVYQSKPEPEPVFDDVFTMPNYDATASYDFSRSEKGPATPVENFPTTPPRQRETQDYAGTPEPEFMGWPVLPAGADEEEELAVGATSNRGGLLLRVALILVVFGLLSFLVYYFLWDQIRNRQEQAQNIAGEVQDPTPAPKPSVDMRKIENSQPPPVTEPPKATNTAAPAAADTAKSGTEVKVPPVTEGRSGHTQTPKPAPQPSQPAPSGGNLTLQVGSFPDQGSANARATKLKESGADALVVKAEIPGRGTWYRVQVGGFKSREEAQSYGNQLRGKGTVQDFIVTTKGK